MSDPTIAGLPAPAVATASTGDSTAPRTVSHRPATDTFRVLQVINGEHYSGAERVQDLLALELPQFGCEVGFACLKPDRFPHARQSLSAALYPTPMRNRFDLRTVRALVELIRTHDYRLVHAHTPRSALVGGLAARKAGVPLVYHVHSPTARDSTRPIQNFLNAKLERWSLRRAARLITVSASLQSQMRQQGFPAPQLSTVPNGVPPLVGPPRQTPSGNWRLGMTALFRPRKGVEVLLEALSELRGSGLDVTLRAIGPFETQQYEAEVKQRTEQLGLSDAVTWTGFAEDITAELQRIDVLVLPSLFGEGLPMVVLEAMAGGVPVVASRVEGVPEAIQHREQGLLVSPGDVDQLTMAIAELVAGKVDYAELSSNARQRHADCFSARAMAADVANIYREVLGRE